MAIICCYIVYAQKPNIIFIMVVYMGWNDIGYCANTEVLTPTLRELATKNGVRLENYYTGPVCRLRTADQPDLSFLSIEK